MMIPNDFLGGSQQSSSHPGVESQAQQVRLATSISGPNAGLMACEQRWLQALKIFHHIGDQQRPLGMEKKIKVKLLNYMGIFNGI